MEPYYLAGYFIVKTRPLRYGPLKNKTIQTCSSCINISAFDINWCLSWTWNINEDERVELGLTDEKIAEIGKWTDQKYNEGTITWGDALPDLETAITFKNLFYEGRTDIDIYSIYMSETDAECLIEDFDFEDQNIFHTQFGLRQNLQKKIEEQDNPLEELLGYDFIGVETSGTFHSFHCHNIIDLLEDKFSLSLRTCLKILEHSVDA